MQLEQYILNDARRAKLIALGPEKLAYSMLEAAAYNPRVNELVNSLSSDKHENLKRYYEKLQQLRRRECYYEWKNRDAFLVRLDDLLKLLRDGAATPEEGITGISALFEADGDFCECCHDDGEIGMFFQCYVCNLLKRYLVDSEEPDQFADELLKLCLNDDYGCRYCLIERASEIFPAAFIKLITEKIENMPRNNDNSSLLRLLKKVNS